MSLSKEYSFNDIYFVEDRINKQLSYNKEYVYELWNEYKLTNIKNIQINEDDLINCKNVNSNYTYNTNEQITLFSF